MNQKQADRLVVSTGLGAFSGLVFLLLAMSRRDPKALLFGLAGGVGAACAAYLIDIWTE